MRNRIANVLAVAALVTFLVGGWAHGASFTYTAQRKEIKAGVLIFPSGVDPVTGRAFYSGPPSDPYVFYVMDRRLDLKPAGWAFVNPLAPSRVTADIKARWDDAYTVGQATTKDMGCYWEVRIDAGLRELSQFDILLIGSAADMNFSLERRDREKLRKLADAGGLIWIEGCSDGQVNTSNFFIRRPGVELQFTNAGPGPPAVVSPPMRSHPLVNRPFQLSWDELNKLGTDNNELTGGGVHVAGSRSLSGLDDHYFTSIILAGASPVVAAAQYGSGHVVAVAERVGDAISDTVAGSSAYCPTARVIVAQPEDLKFAFNIVSWGTEHTTFHKNARHTGYSFEEINAPLVVKWEFNEPAGMNPTSSSPAILDDMIFFVDGGGWLHAFDLSPYRDRDGDRNPDDGIPDLSLGARWDEIWSFNTGPASSPTVAYVPLGGGAAVPAVFVTTLNGEVLAFEAANGARTDLLTVNPFQPDDPTNGKVNIPAPTYVDGVVYIGDGIGHLHAYDFIRNETWTWPRDPRPTYGPALNSPTVGFFRNPMTGSVDQIVYMATRGIPNVTNGYLYSFPVKVFNEVLTSVSKVQGTYKVRKHTQTPIRMDQEAYQLYYTDNRGALVPINDAMVQVVQPGQFRVTPGVVPLGASVVADYEIDTSGQRYQFRQRIPIKTAKMAMGVEGSGVISSPAAGSNDILYYATENGSFYAVQEDGTSFTTKWRWYLGDLPVRTILGMSQNAVPVGSPAVGDDMVYFAVNDGPTGYILAFEADPVFKVQVGTPIDRTRPVAVLQYDSMDPQSPPKRIRGAPVGGSARQRVAYRVDYGKGWITFENFLDPLSASQDLAVEYTPEGNSEPTTYPIEAFDPNYSWNNLSWYFPVGDARITSSPMLMGDMLYFGCDDGQLYALDVKRIRQTAGKFAKVVASPDIAWSQAITPRGRAPGPILATVGGSHGMLAVATTDGLSVLYNGLTLVADSHRLVEIDADGRVVWSCDSTTSMARTTTASAGGPAGAAYGAVTVPFNRPAVARRVGVGTMVVADTGNNRIVFIDKSGNIIFEVSTKNRFVREDAAGGDIWKRCAFVDENDILPAGASWTLNGPTDVTMWMEPGRDPGGNPWPYPEYHFFIADTGNYRVIEVAAKYDPVREDYRNFLVWSTQTFQQGKRYRYTSGRRYLMPGGTTETVCVVSNYVPEMGNLETTGGAVVTIDDGTGWITDVRRFADGPNGSLRLINPTFFDRVVRTPAEYSDVIADANGLYVVDHVGAAVTGIRFYSAYQHRDTTGKPLMVSYVQLLPNGNVLVTNRATGLIVGSGGGGLHGEIFELKYDDTSSSWSISWPLPDMDVGRGSYPLEQPCSAERLYD